MPSHNFCFLNFFSVEGFGTHLFICSHVGNSHFSILIFRTHSNLSRIFLVIHLHTKYIFCTFLSLTLHIISFIYYISSPFFSLHKKYINIISSSLYLLRLQIHPTRTTINYSDFHKENYSQNWYFINVLCFCFLSFGLSFPKKTQFPSQYSSYLLKILLKIPLKIP